jgi:hypothetical protein
VLGQQANGLGRRRLQAAVLGWKGRLASSCFFISFLKQANKFEFKPRFESKHPETNAPA